MGKRTGTSLHQQPPGVQSKAPPQRAQIFRREARGSAGRNSINA
jgi:hypothetical protein